MNPSIETQFEEMITVLRDFSTPDNFAKIRHLAHQMAQALMTGQKIITCGNGGSMADAMHFAEELTGRFRGDRPSFAALAISDPTYLTCVANDYGYQYVFSRFIEGVGQAGDILLILTSSGNSANLVEAAQTAKQKGLYVAALTGNDGGLVAPLCDCEIRAPHFGTADRIQEIHIKIIHSIIYAIEVELVG